MNIIQARCIDYKGDACGYKGTYRVPDGVTIKRDTLLLADLNGDVKVVKSVTDSIEVGEDFLELLAEGEVKPHIIGIFELKELNPEELVPEVDWSKVAVDTPILVKAFEYDIWEKRYFAEYEDGYVYAWDHGATSWSSDGVKIRWSYAKLMEADNTDWSKVKSETPVWVRNSENEEWQKKLFAFVSHGKVCTWSDDKYVFNDIDAGRFPTSWQYAKLVEEEE